MLVLAFRIVPTSQRAKLSGTQRIEQAQMLTVSKHACCYFRLYGRFRSLSSDIVPSFMPNDCVENILVPTNLISNMPELKVKLVSVSNIFLTTGIDF